jgi:muramidase (phage lysozyme)
MSSHHLLRYAYVSCCSLSLVACVLDAEQPPETGLTSAALVSGTACDPDNALGVASAQERALLDTIAFAEGTRDHGKDGYNVTFAYRYFDSCDEHPNLKICSGSLCSTAAGRYQFLYKTYVGLKLPNFWPEQQERGALELVSRRGVTLPAAPLTATQFANALDKLSYEWSSLPPGRYGETRRTLQQIRDEYCKLASCGAQPGPEREPSVNRGHDASGFYAIDRQGILHRYQREASGEFVGRALTSGWRSVTGMGAGADYDLDGETDFVTMDSEYGLELQLGDGADDFWYSPLALTGEPLIRFGAAADYDHDSLPDFVAVDAAGHLILARGDGTGQFDTEALFGAAADVVSLGGGADYDGDGHADFVALRDNAALTLYRGDGFGAFSPQPLELDGPRLRLLGGGADYTRDGRADLLAFTADGEAFVYAGKVSGGFEAQALGSGWEELSFVD